MDATTRLPATGPFVLPAIERNAIMNLRSALLGAVLLAATAAPAFAQDDALISKNQTIYDAEGKRVGKVTRVLEDGSALVIYKGKVVRIGASTLTAAEGKVTTSLSKKELARLD
ncbi:hypothetical protein [Blastomonas sp. UPD001]|jgi:hypothetical protein|uniref:hypothetical protein n=2 Tax=Pseudomonadota TaxID=1224 RepID=UPI001E2FB76C|nr:hypothetical protein [Blastomonas sp. UPD001]